MHHSDSHSGGDFSPAQPKWNHSTHLSHAYIPHRFLRPLTGQSRMSHGGPKILWHRKSA